MDEIAKLIDEELLEKKYNERLAEAIEQNEFHGMTLPEFRVYLMHKFWEGAYSYHWKKARGEE
jgi:hypothetical protein